MIDVQPPTRIQELIDDDRAVSPIIAVALLVLIAVGFTVALQGVGSDLIGSVEQPPEANIDANPDEDQIRLTVESTENVDILTVNHEGQEIEDSDVALSPEAGNSTVINYEDNINDPDAEAGDQISVVATDLPDNEQVVYTYTIPEEADV